MYKALTSLIVVLLTATWAAAIEIDSQSSVNQILDALDQVGRDLKSFTADVRLSETDLFAQETATRTGKVWYQKRPDNDARMRISFYERIKDSITQKQRIEYKLENGWLVDRNYPRKLEVNRQVLRPGERIDLLKLGEGPFPLPIGQSKEEVHKQFEVSKAEADAEDPHQTVHLTLRPRAGTEFERKFESIDVWVSLDTHMPRRIETIDANGMEARTTDLEKIAINVQLKDSDFALPQIAGDEWQRRDEPFER